MRGESLFTSDLVSGFSLVPFTMEIGTPSIDIEVKSLDEATILLEEETENQDFAGQLTLVGKIITDKVLNKGAIRNILIKAWGYPTGLQVSDAGFNKFIFTFNTREAAQEVMCKTPWYVMNKLVSLQWWKPEVAITEINFDKVQFWIQLQGLPLEFISMKNAGKILVQIGEIIEIEDPKVDGKLIRPFIRARIEIDIQKPLSTGCWIPRKNLANLWVYIKYERLQDLCYCCGVIGHEQKGCLKERVMSARGSNIHRYGARVGVAPAKPLKLILEEQARREKKSKGEASNEYTGQTEDSEQDMEGRRELAKQELVLNKERFEYEKMLEREEGDGSVPEGWSEKQDDDTKSPSEGDDHRSTSSSDTEPVCYPNLRLPKNFPASSTVARVGFWRGDKFQYRSKGLGAGIPMGEVQGRTDQKADDENPASIPLSRGSTVTGAGEQNCQSLNQRIIGEKTRGDTGSRQFLEDRREPCQEGTNTKILAADKQDFLKKLDKEGETRKPEWWAQEQKENEVVFAKIQEDLHLIWNEVRAYWEGKGETGPKVKWAGQAESSQQPILGDKLQHVVKSNEGPDNTECFPLLQGCAGLKQQWVTVDHHSPPESPAKYISVQLSREDIKRCRGKCGLRTYRRKNKHYTEDVIMEDKAKEKLSGLPYTVEFPSDEDKENTCRLGDEEENALMVRVSNSLTLKRPRNDMEEEREEVEMTQKKEEQKRARLWGQPKYDDIMVESTHFCMAEEAGHPLPPTSP